MIYFIEGNLEVKRKLRSQTSDNIDDKQRWEESEKSQRREEKKKADQRRENQKKADQRRENQKKADQGRESQEKEDPGARKGSKVAKDTTVSGSGGSNSRPAAEPSGQIRDQKLHAFVARIRFQRKTYRTHQLFGS